MTRAEMRRRLKVANQVADKEAARQKIINKILNYKLNGMPTLKSYVLRFLLDRQQNGFTERMNLDDIWYYLRQNVLLPNNFVIGKYTRSSLKAYVQELCDLLGVKRDDVGIIAQAYATLYFKGRLYDVAIDQLTSLQKLGAFVLIIEKEGIVEVLKPYANKYGVALVTSHGFLTENAAELSTLIKRTSNGNGNVAILTDFDISGLLIALNVPDIPRIGVDFDTLRDLGYDPSNAEVRAQFEEGYTAVTTHWKAVLEHRSNMYTSSLPSMYQELLSDSNLKYLHNMRIEINAVKTAVGAEKLWGFIMRKLHKVFPSADYNRAIDVADIANITPEPLSRLNDAVADQVASITDDSATGYMIKFMGYDGSEKLFPDDPIDGLQEIEYVGPTTARKFVEGGFKTVESIANATVDEITEALYCSEDSANTFIAEAKKVIDSRGREDPFNYMLGNEDNEEEKKPDDYGFIKVKECEHKMTEDFDSQIKNDDDFKPMLDKIEELADDIEELNNRSRRSREDEDE